MASSAQRISNCLRGSDQVCDQSFSRAVPLRSKPASSFASGASFCSCLPGPHRLSSGLDMELLLVAYEPDLGLLQHACDKRVVQAEAFGQFSRCVQRRVDLAAQRGGGTFERAEYVGIAQVGADDHHVNVAVGRVLLLGDRAVDKRQICLLYTS